MKKKLLSLLLALAMCLSLSVPAWAAETLPVEGVQPIVVGNMEIEPPPIEIYGAKPPKNLYNLNGQSYPINGLFDTSIYTEYYFLPNADGELYCNVTVRWPNKYNNVRGMSVECWNKTTGKCVSDNSFEMRQNSDGSYGPAVYSGTISLSGLNSTNFYYFRFTKATDGIDATITGTIYA